VSTPPIRRKRATIHDVAIEAGVSRGTVSRVVNGERYVSAEAREAIESAIAKVGYVPNTAARNLVMQRTQAVGFVVHEPHSLFVDDPNIGNILLGANEALSEADHQLVCLVVDSERDTDRITRYLSGGFVDGVIMVSARENDPITRVIERLGLPATFVGHPPDLRALPFVGIDNRKAAADVTAELVNAGRRRIGMIAAALDRDSGSDRLAGFRDALGDRFDDSLVVDVPLYSYDDGFEIDGVFAASDAVAAGALEALRVSGRRVPDDVSLVGFDDSAWALRCHPPLTTVHQPAAAVGQRAAEVLLAQLRGEDVSLEGSLVPTSVVRRGTV
jgi:DNA-binding LacI/PurR family transcriptional regulator